MGELKGRGNYVHVEASESKDFSEQNTVYPWTMGFLTAWVYLHMDFFHQIYTTVLQNPIVGWICGHRTRDLADWL